MYKRVLLKLSGEQLAGKMDAGIDVEFGAWLAQEVKKVVAGGTQVVIIVGGGNFARGKQLADHRISRVTADKVGILGILMNAMALTDIFESEGVGTHFLSSVISEPFAEPFSHRLANDYLENGRVVIAIGPARPYLSSDSHAVLMALEMNCEVTLKATKVDGVYDKDPAKFPDAKKLDKISFQEAVANDAIKVMDKAAMGLAMEHELPVIVFDSMKENNMLQVAQGKTIGTTIGS